MAPTDTGVLLKLSLVVLHRWPVLLRSQPHPKPLFPPSSPRRPQWLPLHSLIKSSRPLSHPMLLPRVDRLCLPPTPPRPSPGSLLRRPPPSRRRGTRRFCTQKRSRRESQGFRCRAKSCPWSPTVRSIARSDSTVSDHSNRFNHIARVRRRGQQGSGGH